ncbi:hypothetical protein, partial [Staphylococcus chromogenes]|uniref:hypothetical protein n=1 Tax=Staphylococcus chromogenes TaxID=46126 RepID=UPI001A7E0F27
TTDIPINTTTDSNNALLKLLTNVKPLSMSLKSSYSLNCFIPIALLTLSLGTLNNPKTCRIVGLIAHAMPTFVCKFS